MRGRRHAGAAKWGVWEMIEDGMLSVATPSITSQSYVEMEGFGKAMHEGLQPVDEHVK